MDLKQKILFENHKRFGLIPIMFYIPYQFQVSASEKLLKSLIKDHGGIILEEPQSLISHCLVVQIHNDHIDKFNGKKQIKLAFYCDNHSVIMKIQHYFKQLYKIPKEFVKVSVFCNLLHDDIEYEHLSKLYENNDFTILEGLQVYKHYKAKRGMKKHMRQVLKNQFMEKNSELFDQFFTQITTMSEDQWLEKVMGEGRAYSNTLQDIPNDKFKNSKLKQQASLSGNKRKASTHSGESDQIEPKKQKTGPQQICMQCSQILDEKCMFCWACGYQLKISSQNQNTSTQNNKSELIQQLTQSIQEMRQENEKRLDKLQQEITLKIISDQQ